jgi:hypothetical protein
MKVEPAQARDERLPHARTRAGGRGGAVAAGQGRHGSARARERRLVDPALPPAGRQAIEAAAVHGCTSRRIAGRQVSRSSTRASSARARLERCRSASGVLVYVMRPTEQRLALMPPFSPPDSLPLSREASSVS